MAGSDPAGVAAARPARLSVDVPQARYGRSARHRAAADAPDDQDAGSHSIRRRHRPVVRWQGVPVRVHHHRLRRGVRFSCARVERHHAEDHRRAKGTFGWLATAAWRSSRWSPSWRSLPPHCWIPGVYFAINTGAGIVGAAPDAAVHTITGWGFPVTVEQMKQPRHGNGREHLVRPDRRGALAGGRAWPVFSGRRSGAGC